MPDRPSLDALARTLAAGLTDLGADPARYAREGDPVGVWVPSERPVRRLGLRLEAGRAPYGWLEAPDGAPRVDALLLHRPFGVWPARLPDGVGVLAYHGALDDHLSVGTDAALAAALGLADDGDGPLRHKGRAIGATGMLPTPSTPDALRARVVRALGGIAEEAGAELAAPVERIAVVGAMSEALVEAAAARGATVYVTGEVRRAGVAPAERLGVRVLAVGQDRAERWGLRRLGRLAQAAWPALRVIDLEA